MAKRKKFVKKFTKKASKKKFMGRGPAGCPCRESVLKESSLYQFIRAITEKKYNTANKYLADVIEAKMKARIASTL